MRKRSNELVIHVTSIGEFSFLFYFTIFPHLQFTAREFEIFTTGEFEIFTMQNVFPCFDFS